MAVLAERENVFIKSVGKHIGKVDFTKTNVNGLTVYLWKEVWSNSMKHLKAIPGFPLYPDIEYVSNDLRISINQQAIGVRIFGYILPYKKGQYQFKVEASDAQSTEIWLSSDQDPDNMKRMEKDKSNPAQSHSIYETTKIALTEKLYYVEILHATYWVTSNITMYWRVARDYQVIEKANLFQYPTDIIESRDRLPSHFVSLQRNRITDPREEIPLLPPLRQNIVSDAFHNCSYRTHKLKPQNVKRSEGSRMVKEIVVFLSEAGISNPNLLLEGPAIKKFEGNRIKHSFFSDLQTKSGGKLKEFELLNLERIDSEVLGNHYLLEAKVSLRTAPMKKFLISHRIQKMGRIFCLSTVVTQKNAFVYIVIIVQNQARWLQHFIDNINKIYQQTKDEFFGVLIVDFNSKDLDNTSNIIKRTLKIKHYEYIYIESGDFKKVLGQKIALQRVTDPNHIIFNCDLHLNLPITLLEVIRKHTTQGYAVFSPILKRLDGGTVSLDGFGLWDTRFYGLMSMYKSDWIIIGELTMDEKIEWGRADLRIVDKLLTVGYHVNRLRLPGLVHYHYPIGGT